MGYPGFDNISTGKPYLKPNYKYLFNNCDIVFGRDSYEKNIIDMKTFQQLKRDKI